MKSNNLKKIKKQAVKHKLTTKKPIMVAGSLGIAHIGETVFSVIDILIQLKIPIIIGDAPGVDLQIQKYLAECKYKKVTVYHVFGSPRNLINPDWKTMAISGKYYSCKDKAMRKKARGFIGVMRKYAVTPGTNRSYKYFRKRTKMSFVIVI